MLRRGEFADVPLDQSVGLHAPQGFGQHLLGDAREAPAQPGRALRAVNLADRAHDTCGALSKGLRQRVALARALLPDPQVLFLDEPTAGLDPAQIRETRKLIRELGSQHTILLSTHILTEVEMACDSVVVIDRGQVIEEGTLATVRQKHKNQSLEEIFVRLTGQEGI